MTARPGLHALAPLALVERLGGPGRARAVYAALREGRDPYLDPELPAGARRRLAERVEDDSLPVRARHRAADGTLKLLLGLRDGLEVECVLIPVAGRTTLCVSSQVGCARGCTFCLTASMKLLRNLGAGEITAQVTAGLRAAREEGLPTLRNLVLMGMGEPLDNLDAVEAALATITGSGLGLGLGPGHVTTSTVAPTPRAVLAAAALPGHLAWSLHAADDALRARLVPTARHGVAELRDAFQEVLSRRGRAEPLFVELTLIEGVNDGLDHAGAVAALFRGFGFEVRLNLLPLNTVDHPAPPGAAASPGRGPAALRPSPPERVAAFEAALRAAGYFTKVRRARGRDGRAACGQLATEARRLRVLVQ